MFRTGDERKRREKSVGIGKSSQTPQPRSGEIPFHHPYIQKGDETTINPHHQKGKKPSHYLPNVSATIRHCPSETATPPNPAPPSNTAHQKRSPFNTAEPLLLKNVSATIKHSPALPAQPTKRSRRMSQKERKVPEG